MLKIEKIIPLNQEIVIATSSKNGDVKGILVIAKGFVDGKLLFGLCKKGKTYNNLVENPKISIVVKNNGYYRIDGIIEFFEKGEAFNTLLERCNPPIPIVGVLVTINEVWDLDKDVKVKDYN